MLTSYKAGKVLANKTFYFGDGTKQVVEEIVEIDEFYRADFLADLLRAPRQ